MAESSIVLVHGSFFSAWSWIPVIERLSSNQVHIQTVDLPFTSLADDAEALRKTISGVASMGPVTVVCHSYTGITAAVGAHDAQHIVHIAARMPAIGESQSELNKDWGNPDFRTCFQFLPDGTMTLTDEADQYLFNRSPKALANIAMKYRRSMKSEIPIAPIENPAWKTMKSSYIVCTDDLAVKLDQQRLRAGWADYSIEIDSDHSPFFSAPQQTADFILETHLAVVGEQ
ncbi:MAG: putative hydrolase domain [Actinomycetota bacterium]